MSRRPRVVLPSPEPPTATYEGDADWISKRPVLLPSPPDHRALIARICAASHPVWVDLAQRRRWLEAAAETYRTEAAKTVAICKAASEIGFRFE